MQPLSEYLRCLTACEPFCSRHHGGDHRRRWHCWVVKGNAKARPKTAETETLILMSIILPGGPGAIYILLAFPCEIASCCRPCLESSLASVQAQTSKVRQAAKRTAMPTTLAVCFNRLTDFLRYNCKRLHHHKSQVIYRMSIAELRPACHLLTCTFDQIKHITVTLRVEHAASAYQRSEA